MKFRVWMMMNFGPLSYIPVTSPRDGILLIEHLADVQLNTPGITDNAFGIEVYGSDGVQDWVEWYDDEGIGADEYSVEDGCVVRSDGFEMLV